MSVTLTQGAVEALFKGVQVDNPVLQLLNIRQISSASGPPRFRLLMSDGQHSLSSLLLATQLNHLHEQNLLVPNCVCLLKKTITNTLSDGRNVVIVMDLEILQSAEETGGKIGDPTPYSADGKTSSPQKVSSSTSVSASPPSAAAPGTSYSSSNTFSPSGGRGRGFTGKAPMKASPMKTSPMKASPMMTSPMKASPMMTSPMKASPMKASPMKTSPMKASPMKATSSSPGSTTKMMPIANLNPYQSKWTIRARVTNKSNIRTWSNSRGEGKLFSFEIVDESGEIRITAFNNEVDKFFSLVEQGKVYYISKATLKVANKQYTTLKNEYEMTLHAHSSIVPCDDSHDVPTLNCDFVPIAELENRDKDAIIDVIGVCKSAEDVSRITTKSSREVSKRALSLIDTTGKVVTVTLWGKEAEKFDSSGQPVVAIKGARLSDFGGRSLSALFSSTVMVNPDIPEAFRLRAWYDHEGHALDSQSLTEARSSLSGSKMNWKMLSDVKSEGMGHGEKADYFSCVATVLYIRKENCLYQACPSADCNKKVIDQHNGLYRCEKCNRDFPNFKYRLLLSANLADFGDNQWVTCFQETAEVLLGHSAESLGQLRDTDEEAFDEVFQKANFKTHIFKNRVKLETYNVEGAIDMRKAEWQCVLDESSEVECSQEPLDTKYCPPQNSPSCNDEEDLKSPDKSEKWTSEESRKGSDTNSDEDDNQQRGKSPALTSDSVPQGKKKHGEEVDKDRALGLSSPKKRHEPCSEDGNSQLDGTSQRPPQKKKKKQGKQNRTVEKEKPTVQVKRRWSQVEKRAVHKHLANFVEERRIPGKEHCMQCIKKEKALARRSWRDVKNFVSNTVFRLNRRSVSKILTL